MNEKQYEALLRIPGLRAAKEAVSRELDQAMKDAMVSEEAENAEPEEAGRLTEMGRKRIAEAQKRRWARDRAARGDVPDPGPKKSKSEAWTPEMRAAQAEKIRLARERKVKGAGQGSEERSSDEPESET